jgi:hypothetical protein
VWDYRAYAALLSHEGLNVASLSDAVAYLTKVQERLAYTETVSDSLAEQLVHEAHSLISATIGDRGATNDERTHSLAYKATITDRLVTNPNASAVLASSGIIDDEGSARATAITVP